MSDEEQPKGKRRSHPYKNEVSLASHSGKDGQPLMRLTWESWHDSKQAQVTQQQVLYWGIKNFMEEVEMSRAEEGTGINVAKGKN
jgi:hypothetical protein